MTDLDRVRQRIDRIAETAEIPNTGKRGRPARGKFSSGAQRINQKLAAAGIDYRIDQRLLYKVYRGESSAAVIGFVRYVLTDLVGEY